MGRQHEGVAVAEMLGNEIIQKRPFQLRTDAGVQPVAVAAHLHAPLVIDQAQARAQIHVVLGLEVKDGLFAEDLYHLVVFLSAGLHVVRGQVGQCQHEFVDLLFQRTLLLVHFLHPVGHGLQGVQHFGNVLALLFQHGNFLVHAVALGLQVLVFHQQLLAARVPGKHFREIHVVFPLFQGFLDVFGIGTNQINVQHGSSS